MSVCVSDSLVYPWSIVEKHDIDLRTLKWLVACSLQ